MPHAPLPALVHTLALYHGVSSGLSFLERLHYSDIVLTCDRSLSKLSLLPLEISYETATVLVWPF
eukprot:2844317-Amphidinium_carterae.1